MEPIGEQIRALSDSQLAEAVEFYVSDALAIQSPRDLEERLRARWGELGLQRDQLYELQGDFSGDWGALRQMLQYILERGAEANQEQADLVQQAITASGEKQIVIQDPNGVIRFALAAVVLLYWLHLTKGKIYEKHLKPDGSQSEIRWANPTKPFEKLLSLLPESSDEKGTPPDQQ